MFNVLFNPLTAVWIMYERTIRTRLVHCTAGIVFVSHKEVRWINVFRPKIKINKFYKIHII